MIIINMQGGLGNQMFQYALKRKLDTVGKKTKVHFRNKNCLQIFPLNLNHAKKKELRAVTVFTNRYVNYVVRRMLKKNKFYYKEMKYQYHPSIFTLDHVYLDGFWQSEKYFLDIRKILLDEFQFSESKNEKNTELIKKMKTQECVGIHIRRGDYLSNEMKPMFGNICTLDYYKKAIQFFTDKENICFIFFSNDPQWTAKHFQIKNKIIVDWNQNEDYMDLYLMSQCDHNIIANSSFSWWGAWLNQHENKTVIAPKKWLNTCEMPDICPKDWIRV